MERKQVAVSQSLMKSLSDYNQGKECGLVLKAKFLESNWGQSSDAMKLGQFFEYRATGQLPKSGEVPLPELTLKGEYTTDYQRALMSAEYAKVIFKAMDIQIITTGERIHFRDAVGDLDIRGFFRNRPAVIDLKYSGLLDDKWNEIGWHVDTLSEKDRLLIQPNHYLYLADNHYGVEHDFYFMLFNTKNPMDVRMIQIIIDPIKKMKHIEDIKVVKKKFEYMIENDDFKPRGSLLKCSECFLNETCPSRVLLPQIQTVYY